MNAIKTRNFAFQSHRTRQNSNILCVICGVDARKFSFFKAQIAVQRHYLMWCNVLTYLHAKIGGGGKTILPPPQNGGGANALTVCPLSRLLRLCCGAPDAAAARSSIRHAEQKYYVALFVRFFVCFIYLFFFCTNLIHLQVYKYLTKTLHSKSDVFFEKKITQAVG